jgi:hypothetical protein
MKKDTGMHTVRIHSFLILSVLLLATLISCFEHDEDCVTVDIQNSSSEEIEVSFPECMSWWGTSIAPGKTGAISVLLGQAVWADGHYHVFRMEYEIWEIWETKSASAVVFSPFLVCHSDKNLTSILLIPVNITMLDQNCTFTAGENCTHASLIQSCAAFFPVNVERTLLDTDF